MQKLLTEAAVAKLKPDPSKRLEIHDTVVPNLRLRVSSKGKKSWSYMYKVAGAAIDGKRGPNKRLTIGEYPLIDLKTARQKALEAKELTDKGIDPSEHRKQEILGLNERRFDKVVDRFVELHLKPNTKNWKDTSRLLIVTAVSVWKSTDITKIDRAAVHELIDNISEQKGISYAREVRKHLSILFNWAADRGICPFSPMAGMKRADLRYKPRDRVLSIEEIRAVWNAAEEMGYPFGPIVQLLILTGQRRSEIANIQRSWINPEYMHFEVPASEYKTGVPHVVPLTSKSQLILQNQPLWNGGDFVFSSTNGRTPSSGFSKAKLRIDKACDLEPWTFHDLRRSVATHMARIGIIQEHIERVLGHTIVGVAGTYNRYSYLEEKQKALNLWESDLFNNLS